MCNKSHYDVEFDDGGYLFILFWLRSALILKVVLCFPAGTLQGVQLCVGVLSQVVFVFLKY